MTPFIDYHRGHFQEALDFDSSAISPDAQLPLRVLQLRARIALGEAAYVLSELAKGDAAVPELAAVRAMALFVAGKQDAGLAEAEKLAASDADNAYVQVIAGTVLAAADRSDEALSVLARHQGSLEAVALVVQLHLAANRPDAAAREVGAARKWAQDSLLVNLAESWVGLRAGGDRYQQAFYEFEDMPVHQAVAELHLGRLPEAEAALGQVRAERPDDVGALANSVALEALAGRETDALVAELARAAPVHPLVADLKEKEELFTQCAAKYSPKVAA